MYKQLATKNYKWVLAYNTFFKSAKGVPPYNPWDKVYHNGFHAYHFDCGWTFSIVFGCRRIILKTPIGKRGQCQG